MAPRRSRAVTIRDVARLSGVSVATVTRTLQGSIQVRPETQARVRAAAEQLGYRPDTVARALVTGSSETIGLLVPSITLAYWSEVADAIERRAADQGYSVILASTRGEAHQQHAMLELMLGKRLDGIILGGMVAEPNTRGAGVPLVLLDWDSTPQPDLFEEASRGHISESLIRLASQRPPGEWFAHLTYDDVENARLVAGHLLALGHERISVVTGPPVRSALLRLLGVRSATEEAGQQLLSVHSGADSLDSGRRIAVELLGSPQAPTAIVCTSDNVAIGAMRGAHDLGFRVPQDVSVMGYDDIPVASYVDPALTTLRNPKRRLGELALDLVIDPSNGEEAHFERRLAGEVQVRESTGVPGDRLDSARRG